MGAAATSALSQLSGLDDILGIGPISSPPRDQVVPSRSDPISSKETVKISMVHSSERAQEVYIIPYCVCGNIHWAKRSWFQPH